MTVLDTKVSQPSRGLTILGSTGTIGINALKLVAQYPQQFHVVALSAGNNLKLLAEQIVAYKPKRVAIQNSGKIAALQALLPATTVHFKAPQILAGEEGTCEVAASPEADIVVSAIVGFAGVKPTLAAIEAGKQLALANKEAVIAAGPLLFDRLKSKRVRLIPVDSEHSAIMQALHAKPTTEQQLKKIILTASGGPFLHWENHRLAEVTPEQALKHPTWSMGAKISIDSATMMNKGLEVIEATQLFNLPASQVEIVVHPESIIHSMIEYVDGSMLAQLGVTDMRGPLAYAMAYPLRLDGALPSLSLAQLGKLTFLEPNFDKFPCLRLAYHAAKIGQSVPAVLNAANEICVQAFLDKKIGFMGIPKLIERVLELHQPVPLKNLSQLCEIDAWARVETKKLF
jgi:1-deoxy-D-xylulose-5-phosphate reductoisomerase